MPENHINKLAKIDTRLQLLNEERLALTRFTLRKMPCWSKALKSLKTNR